MRPHSHSHICGHTHTPTYAATLTLPHIPSWLVQTKICCHYYDIHRHGNNFSRTKTWHVYDSNDGYFLGFQTRQYSLLSLKLQRNMYITSFFSTMDPASTGNGSNWKEGMCQFHKKVQQILTNALSSPHIHSCTCPSLCWPCKWPFLELWTPLGSVQALSTRQNYSVLPQNSQTPASHLTLVSTLNTFCHPTEGSSKFLQTACTKLHHITSKEKHPKHIMCKPKKPHLHAQLQSLLFIITYGFMDIHCGSPRVCST